MKANSLRPIGRAVSVVPFFKKSAFCLALLGPLGSYGQGTVGFSSQTQPSILRGTQTLGNTIYSRVRNRVAAPDFSLSGQSATSLALSTYGNTVPDTTINISNASTLLEVFDEVETKAEGRRGLGNWLVGIVSDGDFNKPITGAVATGKAGSLGIDAVFMKDVYTTYTYYLHDKSYVPPAGLSTTAKIHLIRNHSDSLVGYQHVARPRVALNTLVVLFAGTSALTTAVPKTQTGTAPINLGTQRAFGQALLLPNGYVAGNGLSFSSNLTYYLGRFGPHGTSQDGLSESGRWGISASLVAVQTNWSSRDTTTVVNILAPSLGIVYRAVEGHLKVGNQDNYAQILPFVRYTMRHLFGDVQNASGERLLADALGTSQRSYHAIDIGMMLSINAVRLTTNIPVFFGEKIEGFSRGQFIAGFGLTASIPISK